MLVPCAIACGDDGAAGSGDAGPSERDGASGPVDGGGRDTGTRPDAGPGVDSGPGVDAGPGGDTLSDEHPGDVGLGASSDVVWFEDFEEGSVGAVAARYDQSRDSGRWTLSSDTPNGSGSSLGMRAGAGMDAVDFYKQLPDHDEWWVRWYAKYEPGVDWHHSGVWFGGYNPGMTYPSPQAGRRPNGDDRFSISVEPVYGVGSASPRFDFYNYWMTMHSWMADPISDDGTAYYGNGLVHRNDFTVDEGSWVCLEVHVRLNPDPSSPAGAVLEVWKNDALMQSFTDAGPMGYWIRDKFCPEGADGSECTDYPAPFDQTLDLRLRNDPGLRLNAFWPQNYITGGSEGTLWFDQMVVATRRVGCMR